MFSDASWAILKEFLERLFVHGANSREKFGSSCAPWPLSHKSLSPFKIIKISHPNESWGGVMWVVSMVDLPYCLLCVLRSRIHHPCLILDNMKQLPKILHNSLQEKCAWGLKCVMSSPMSLSQVGQDGNLPFQDINHSKTPRLWCSMLNPHSQCQDHVLSDT